MNESKRLLSRRAAIRRRERCRWLKFLRMNHLARSRPGSLTSADVPGRLEKTSWPKSQEFEEPTETRWFVKSWLDKTAEQARLNEGHAKGGKR